MTLTFTEQVLFKNLMVSCVREKVLSLQYD